MVNTILFVKAFEPLGFNTFWAAGIYRM